GGLDLSLPFDDAVRDALLAALNAHKILIFPDQDLSKDAQVAFTRRFGEIEGHIIRNHGDKPFGDVHLVSNLDADGKPTTTPRSSANLYWHTDKSYHDVPSLATTLHAIAVPPEGAGGGTQYANMELAYAALPDFMKEKIAGLRAVHSWQASRDNTYSRPATEDEIKEKPPVAHPLVRTHPGTGRKSLYMGNHTAHIDGMPVGEGRALLYHLLDFATRPGFQYTHYWKPGQVVMWDNRCLLHRAAGDFEMDRYPRLLHRTVIRGTKPY
ncbi:MAG: TauD/TfdA family dioxygenase, partial [Proteobacteria bacterium]|nr:TauD/TfdA family dioxygenase [Pseudomonadota bacterium]